MDFSAKYYVIKQIDGDYAHLQEQDEPEITILAARALLPQNIRENSVVKYETLQYELIQ